MRRSVGWSWLVLAACGPTVGSPGQEGGGSGESGGASASASNSGVDDSSSDDGPDLSRCGDGIVDPDESCDEGGATPSCNEHCRVPGSLLQEVVLAGCGAQAVQGDANGDVVVLEDGCISGTNVHAVQLTRLDRTGATLWSDVWTDPDSSYASAYALALDPAGNAVVVGTAGDGNFVDADSRYAWTRKHDPTGALLWMDVHAGEAGTFFYAYDVAVDGAGNVRVAGSASAMVSLRQLDPAGAFVTATEYDLMSGLDHTVSVAANASGSFVVAVNQQPADDGWITGVFLHAGTGTPVWSTAIDLAAGGRDLPVGIELADDGSVHVVGEFEDAATHENTVYVTAIAPAGDLAWTWQHDAPSDACDVAIDRSGNAFVLLAEGDYEAQSLVLTRLSATGAVDWQQTLVGPGELGMDCGIGLDADENPVVAAEPVEAQSWVAWFAR